MPITDEELQRIDQALVNSVFGGSTLPGTDAVLRLPDLQFLVRDGTVRVANDEPSALPEDDDLPVRLLAVDADPDSESAYLQLTHDADPGGAELRVTVQARVRPPAGARALGLSSAQVVFRLREGEWVADPDIVLSSS